MPSKRNSPSLTIRNIDVELCDKILASHKNVAPFDEMSLEDARTLLLGSFYVEEISGKPYCAKDSSGEYVTHIITHVLKNIGLQLLIPTITKKTPPPPLPLILLEGNCYFSFSSNSLAHPQITIKAPHISQYSHLGSDSFGINVFPDIYIGENSKSVIFSPILFEQFARKYTSLYRHVLAGSERQLTEILRYLSANSSILSVDRRIARFLLMCLSNDHSKIETIHVSQYDIAAILDCSRASVTAGLSRLYDRGIVETGRGKIVVDTEKLKEYLR